MSAKPYLHTVLRDALTHNSTDCPAQLMRAMHDAVLAGGARLRPQLCLATAGADATRAEPAKAPADAWLVASAIELLHCASLVHDDLPCFDDATLRRGKPTVHARYGEACAVLVGDALIMTAFAQLGRLNAACAMHIHRELAHASRRMVWGQALESEPGADLKTYHGHKTAALFQAAAVCGAWLAAERAGERAPAIEAWRRFGGQVGALYQMADDILDVACAHNTAQAPKSAGRDAALGRPNAALRLGLPEARAALAQRLLEAHQAIVPGAQAASVGVWLDGLIARLGRLPGLWQDLKPLPTAPVAASKSPAQSAERPLWAQGGAAL